MVFLLRRRYKYIEGLLTGVLLLCFLNAFILPFQAEILDGRNALGGVADNPLPLVRNLSLFLAFTILSARLRKLLRFTAIPLLLIATVFTVSNISTMNKWQVVIDNKNREQEAIFESASTFSTERNVIVIVMDMLQGSIAERTFQENPQLKESFDGFTVFTRAFTSFPFTRFSASVIMSGKQYTSEDPSYREHIRQAYLDSFLSDMKNEEARVTLLGSMPAVGTQDEYPYVGRITPLKPWPIYSSASSASLARITGYWMRSPFGIFISEETNDWESTEFAAGIEKKLGDKEIVDKLTEELSVSEEQDNVIYFWNQSTHTPIIFTKDGHINTNNLVWYGVTEQDFIDEAYFFLAQLSLLFEAMREQDVYDNSLIIIVSDHGASFSGEAWAQHLEHLEEDFAYGASRYGNFMAMLMYNSVLMIKPPNSFGQAIITHNAAWNGDVRALISYYYEDFSYKPAIDVMAGIRAKNPEVEALFASAEYSFTQIRESTEYHETLYITELHDIPVVFAAHSGITEW